MKKFKIINRTKQVLVLILKDNTSSVGSRQINLMPKGTPEGTIDLTEDQISYDISVKERRKLITVLEIKEGE